ncbi:uncharacterized protein EKO05_0000217 [Ascochyta rabiei]|uniref:uncharacterized protein n=1 Tax=Didymella rabiei TaxID=5454 RepID=UPI001900F633|nr:uncharacterized protein EKO05_0000217 [Ascochyta rabiei]UPX09529.1 hypothetical protein EKO05_0000217 [Ascochyta rabiei]
MKPEALDAFATQSIRPGTLEAAAASPGETGRSMTEASVTQQEKVHLPEQRRPPLNRLNTPLGQRIDGTEAAAKVVEEAAQVVEGVVQGVKAAIHEAVLWAEKKAEVLAHSEDHAGPYDSPATCAGGVSDLDVMATGVLPATIPVQEDGKDRELDGGHKSGGRDSRL